MADEKNNLQPDAGSEGGGKAGEETEKEENFFPDGQRKIPPEEAWNVPGLWYIVGQDPADAVNNLQPEIDEYEGIRQWCRANGIKPPYFTKEGQKPFYTEGSYPNNPYGPSFSLLWDKLEERENPEDTIQWLDPETPAEGPWYWSGEVPDYIKHTFRNMECSVTIKEYDVWAESREWNITNLTWRQLFEMCCGDPRCSPVFPGFAWLDDFLIRMKEYDADSPSRDKGMYGEALGIYKMLARFFRFDYVLQVRPFINYMSYYSRWSQQKRRPKDIYLEPYGIINGCNSDSDRWSDMCSMSYIMGPGADIEAAMNYAKPRILEQDFSEYDNHSELASQTVIGYVPEPEVPPLWAEWGCYTYIIPANPERKEIYNMIISEDWLWVLDSAAPKPKDAKESEDSEKEAGEDREGPILTAGGEKIPVPPDISGEEEEAEEEPFDPKKGTVSQRQVKKLIAAGFPVRLADENGYTYADYTMPGDDETMGTYEYLEEYMDCMIMPDFLPYYVPFEIHAVRPTFPYDSLEWPSRILQWYMPELNTLFPEYYAAYEYKARGGKEILYKELYNWVKWFSVVYLRIIKEIEPYMYEIEDFLNKYWI